MKFLPYMEYTKAVCREVQRGQSIAGTRICLRSLRSSSLLDCLLDGGGVPVSGTAKLKVSR